MRIAGRPSLAAWSKSTVPTKVRHARENAKGASVHIRRTTGMVASRGRIIRVTVGLLLLGGIVPGVATTAAAAQLRLATGQTTAAQLAQEYLSALAPAGGKFVKVEAALKALGPSATTAQVLATVAPLGHALAPIEALLATPPPTTLEALGEQVSFGEDTTTYRTTGQGARLDVGGKLYPNGFQVNTGNGGVTLMWPAHDRPEGDLDVREHRVL